AEYDINKRVAKTGRHNILNKNINAKNPYDCISIILKDEIPIYRDRLYEDSTAICFGCIKLMHINVNLASKASQFDLMKDYYNYKRSNPQTNFERARLIQRFWKIFREKELLNAYLV
ncbi:30061_t:CDS:2, partial [Gigaspora margarita]